MLGSCARRRPTSGTRRTPTTILGRPVFAPAVALVEDPARNKAAPALAPTYLPPMAPTPHQADCHHSRVTVRQIFCRSIANRGVVVRKLRHEQPGNRSVEGNPCISASVRVARLDFSAKPPSTRTPTARSPRRARFRRFALERCAFSRRRFRRTTRGRRACTISPGACCGGGLDGGRMMLSVQVGTAV